MKDIFPLEVKRGNAAVTIYRIKNRHYVEYRLAWYGPDGKRQVKSFSDPQQAKDEAAAKVNELSRGEVVSLDLTGEDRLAYIRAVETLKPFGVPLEMAAMQFAEASKLLPRAVSLVDAAKFYRKRNNLNAPQKTVAECCAEMIAAKKADGLSHRHIKDLDNRCGTFAKSFSCNIGNVTEADISGWLRGLDVSGRTRNNYRMAIISLFRFAVAQSYIPKDHLDADKIASAKKRTGAIEIFTPNEIAAFLAGADDETRAFVAIGAFAGLRSSEIERMDWSHVDLQRNHITVHAHKGTAQRRLVPILPNLREWLLPIAKPEGQLWRFKNTQKPIARLSKKTGIPWKANALRHSFISYRVAQIQNVAQVALECGNSPTMIFRNYREIVRPSDAQAWFFVAPASGEKIIALAAV